MRVALYLVHGLLHLCGYDDLTEQELQVMRAREREILQHLEPASALCLFHLRYSLTAPPRYLLTAPHWRPTEVCPSSAVERTGADK